MIEANVEIYAERAAGLGRASNAERKVLTRFLHLRASHEEDGEDMTAQQKTAALDRLAAAKSAREAAATLVDEAFDASQPIE